MQAIYILIMHIWLFFAGRVSIYSQLGLGFVIAYSNTVICVDHRRGIIYLLRLLCRSRCLGCCSNCTVSRFPEWFCLYFEPQSFAALECQNCAEATSAIIVGNKWIVAGYNGSFITAILIHCYYSGPRAACSKLAENYFTDNWLMPTSICYLMLASSLVPQTQRNWFESMSNLLSCHGTWLVEFKMKLPKYAKNYMFKLGLIYEPQVTL